MESILVERDLVWDTADAEISGRSMPRLPNYQMVFSFNSGFGQSADLPSLPTVTEFAFLMSVFPVLSTSFLSSPFPAQSHARL